MLRFMEIDPQLVKQLREKTNAGFMDCKRALTEGGGDLEKAEAILRMKGIASAGKKASRTTKEGIVASYIHLQGKVGVLVEVNCETDFVAKNQIFRDFVKDITLHIAAAHPLYVSREDVPGSLIEAEREIYLAQVKGKFRGLLHSNPTKKDYETRFTGNTLCRRTARSLQRREPIGKGTSENGQTRQFGRAERSLRGASRVNKGTCRANR